MTRHVLAGLVLPLLFAGVLTAEDPKLPNVKDYDKLVLDTLRDVHNRGADLYNETKDYAGTYRLYEGALITIRPLLAYRPAAQKLIDEGLAAAEKEAGIGMKAFKLHETIEAVRTLLKKAPATTKAPETKAPETKNPEPTKTPETKKAPDAKKTPDAKSPETKKPSTQYELAPAPHEKKTNPSSPKSTSSTTPSKTSSASTTITAAKPALSGKVILKGQPLTAAEVTLVSLDLPKPRVFTAALDKDGSFLFPQSLPPGKYVVIVTAKAVPEKYQTTTTSGLTLEVTAGSANFDVNLK